MPGLPSQTMTSPPSLGVKREIPEVPVIAPTSVKKPRGAPPVPPASLLMSGPGVATKAGSVVVPKCSQLPSPGLKSPPLIVTPPKAYKSAVPYTPTPPKQSMGARVKKEEHQSGHEKIEKAEEQVKQVEHIEQTVGISTMKSQLPVHPARLKGRWLSQQPSHQYARNKPVHQLLFHQHHPLQRRRLHPNRTYNRKWTSTWPSSKHVWKPCQKGMMLSLIGWFKMQKNIRCSRSM